METVDSSSWIPKEGDFKSCKLWQFCREKSVNIWCLWVKFSDVKAARSYWNSKATRGKSLILEGMSHCWKLSLENKSCPFPLPFNIKKTESQQKIQLLVYISCELVMLEGLEGNAFVNALNMPHRDLWMCLLRFAEGNGKKWQEQVQILLNGLASLSRGSQLCFIWPKPINVIHGIATLWINSPPSMILNY